MSFRVSIEWIGCVDSSYVLVAHEVDVGGLVDEADRQEAQKSVHLRIIAAQPFTKRP